jgi:hypothetical protein
MDEASSMGKIRSIDKFFVGKYEGNLHLRRRCRCEDDITFIYRNGL